jgi:hypothetical protein
MEGMHGTEHRDNPEMVLKEKRSVSILTGLPWKQTA